MQLHTFAETQMFLSHPSSVFTAYSNWDDIIHARLALVGLQAGGVPGEAQLQGVLLAWARREYSIAVVPPGEVLSCQLMQHSQAAGERAPASTQVEPVGRSPPAPQGKQCTLTSEVAHEPSAHSLLRSHKSPVHTHF